MTQGAQLPLSAEQMLTKAQHLTNIDIEDSDALIPLTRLIDSFNTESNLHEAGALAVQNRLLRSLCNRLRMLRDFREHPEIHEQTIKQPIFVAGFLRTGSTKVQRLFSASEDFNFLTLWKTLNMASYSGEPNEDVNQRISDAEQYVDEFFTATPKAAAVHDQAADIAEEESYIFCQQLRCGGYQSYANVPSYLNWLATEDMASTYQYLRDALKYLQWQGLADPNKRWFLKSPFHWGQEEHIKALFPDASLIYTHRPPVEFIPSMCSLMSTYMEWHTDATAVDGTPIMAGFAYNTDRHLAFRKTAALPILDLNYRDATNNVEDVIECVYTFLNEPLDKESRARMLAWNQANPINKHGSHQYTPEDFGLSKLMIEEQSSQYMKFYNQEFSGGTKKE